MTLLDPSELAEIQSLARSGMTSIVTILTRTVVETENGQEAVWATVGEDVSAWVSEKTGMGATLGAIAGAVGVAEVFSIRIPVGSDVHSGDQLAVGSTLYMVEHLNEGDTYPAWLDCTCRTVK